MVLLKGTLTCLNSNKLDIKIDPMNDNITLVQLLESSMGFLLHFPFLSLILFAAAPKNFQRIYLHWFWPNLAVNVSLPTRVRSLPAPWPGLILFGFPTLEHFGFPAHQPPGVKPSFLLRSNSLSILSRTGSSRLNFRAKAAPLPIILVVSLMLRVWGCCLGGISQEI